jgi:hypothetical protein
MIVKYYNAEFNVPDLMIEKFAKDFECLPGNGQYDSIRQIRESVYDILDIVVEEPELLDERDYRVDFVNALAMRQALAKHGILYDA